MNEDNFARVMFASMLQREHDSICMVNPRRNSDKLTSGINRLFLQYRQNISIKMHPTHAYMAFDIAEDWRQWYTQGEKIHREETEIMRLAIHPESKFAKIEFANEKFDYFLEENRISSGCSPDCSECCHDLFYITENEFLYLTAWYLRKHGFAALYKVYRKAIRQAGFVKENAPRLSASIAEDYEPTEPEYYNLGEWMNLIEPCAFLDKKGKCGCYQARPAICRLYGTASKCSYAKGDNIIPCIDLRDILSTNFYLQTQEGRYMRQCRPLYYFFLTMFSRENILETLSTIKQFICLSEEEFVMWRGKENMDRI